MLIPGFTFRVLFSNIIPGDYKSAAGDDTYKRIENYFPYIHILPSWIRYIYHLSVSITSNRINSLAFVRKRCVLTTTIYILDYTIFCFITVFIFLHCYIFQPQSPRWNQPPGAHSFYALRPRPTLRTTQKAVALKNNARIVAEVSDASASAKTDPASIIPAPYR